ncbi:MAG TPA: glutamyl-tRNA reductase, partial [Chthonomonadaceae bacterium]|nr:glutamyl-tRNA reductase [Chthonomonadaceae bacterium]
HHLAPIEIRERLSCPEHRLPAALAALAARPAVREAALLFTCNRTEIYAVVAGPDWEAAYAVLRDHLAAFHDMPEPLFAPYLYCKPLPDAALHLARVASGLDSLVLGEAQILGQVRSALKAAQEASTAGAQLNALFQHALTCGKRVQTETSLRQGSLSIGAAAVELAVRIFGDLRGARALILGAGKMSVLTMRDMAASGVSSIAVANRTYERAVELARQLGGKAIQYDSFPDAIATVDIVISSTAAPQPILRRDMLHPILRKRRGRPLFLIDIAVPRDIEAAVGDLDNVFLYNIDDLQEVAADGARGRAERAQAQAEEIASEEAAKLLARLRSRAVTPVLAELRGRADQLLDRRLALLRGRLGGLTDRELEVITVQFRSFADELLLPPTLRLKREAGEPTGDRTYDLATATSELFGLGEAADETRAGTAVPGAVATEQDDSRTARSGTGGESGPAGAAPAEPLQEVGT